MSKREQVALAVAWNLVLSILAVIGIALMGYHGEWPEGVAATACTFLGIGTGATCTHMVIVYLKSKR